MVVIRGLKDILSIKIKARHDTFCDQFNRLFMTRVLLIMSVIMGFDYYSDKVSCITNLDKEFTHSACWITGFYIYEEMRGRPADSSYYGIPEEIRNNGMKEGGSLCKHDSYPYAPDCIPMTKAYFLHYQWMPFYVGSLAIFYYVPYIIFRMVNTDLVSLKAAMKSIPNGGDSEAIVKNYFNYKVNPVFHLRLRIWWNVFVKTLYVLVSLITFYLTDFLLGYRFAWYGKDYIVRSIKSATTTYDVNKKVPTTGIELLPTMGLCDIFEANTDHKRTIHNTNTSICEISPNVLYQYILMVLWFFFVTSIVLSVIGMFLYLLTHAYHLGLYCSSSKKTMYQTLTLREVEYLEYIKKKNMVIYGDVVRRLEEERTEKHPDHYNSNGVPLNTTFYNGHYITTKESYKLDVFAQK